jgi:hypothetical protein
LKEIFEVSSESREVASILTSIKDEDGLPAPIRGKML